jgi:hypothetical protein
MRPTTRRLGGLLLAAALLPAAAPAAAPAAPAAAQEQAVAKGAVVSVDLSHLPSRVARRGSATCLGTRLTATGEGEVVTCQRPFGFDAPVDADPLVLVFHPKGGGPPTRHRFPLAWDPRPHTFTVPAAGTVGAEAPPADAGPRPMPPALAAQARAAAAGACGDCKGASGFTLKDFTLEEARTPAQAVAVTIQPPPQAP